MKKTTWPGNWKVTCHRCGFWFPSTEIQKEWTGLLVCNTCVETRHPQTLIKVRGETAFPTFVSTDGTDVFAGVCDVSTYNAYADLGTADCLKADSVTVPYLTALGIKGNGHI